MCYCVEASCALRGWYRRGRGFLLCLCEHSGCCSGRRRSAAHQTLSGCSQVSRPLGPAGTVSVRGPLATFPYLLKPGRRVLWGSAGLRGRRSVTASLTSSLCFECVVTTGRRRGGGARALTAASLAPQVPAGGGLHRHHPGCEVSASQSAARPDRRRRRPTAGDEGRAHGERHRAVLAEGQRRGQVGGAGLPEPTRWYVV